MASDIFYTIGSTHQICQDYALTDGESYVVISDGCSSAKDTDWGSRLLAQCLVNSNFDYHQALFNAKAHVDSLKLHPDCLLSTLLCAFKRNGVITTLVWGDGYVIARERLTKKLVLISHVFDSGAPYYLYYELGGKQGYVDVYGKSKLRVTTSYEKLGWLIDLMEIKADSGLITRSFSVKEYDLVAVISDGLKSFVQQQKQETSIINMPVDIMSIIPQLFSLKTTDGQFMHRRCIKMFRDLNAQNIKNTDDFSVGVLVNCTN